MKPGFDHIGVGCGGFVVNDRNETFLLLRGKNTRGNHGEWNQPGGMVEVGDSIEYSIVRELKEEIGIDVEFGPRLWARDRINPDGSHWVAFVHLVQVGNDAEPFNAEPEKHDDARWFSLDDLPENLGVDTQWSLEAYQKM